MNPTIVYNALHNRSSFICKSFKINHLCTHLCNFRDKFSAAYAVAEPGDARSKTSAIVSVTAL